MHPGGLVKSFTPASPPGPAPSKVGYLWGVDPAKAGHGWSVGAVGVAAPLKYAPTGLCVDATGASQGAQLMLKACSGAAEQSFVLEANGNLHGAAGSKMCLAMENWEGPGVVAYACNTGENEEMVWDASAAYGAGTLCSKGSPSHAARCLDVKSDAPQGGGSAGTEVLIYAKPQPRGAVAVLVINTRSDAVDKVPVDFADVHLAAGAKGVEVLDIWDHTTSTLPAGATRLVTDAIVSHDSRFYLLSPAA